MRTLSIALLLVFLGGGCADAPNTLNGSLSEVYDIHFEHVRARIYSSELAIEYVDVSGAVPVRVTLSVVDTTVVAGVTYDLSLVGDITGRSDNDIEIPRFTEGKLTIDEYVRESGALVVGDFKSKYATSRDSLTLSGDFETELEIVDRTPGD